MVMKCSSESLIEFELNRLRIEGSFGEFICLVSCLVTKALSLVTDPRPSGHSIRESSHPLLLLLLHMQKCCLNAAGQMLHHMTSADRITIQHNLCGNSRSKGPSKKGAFFANFHFFNRFA